MADKVKVHLMIAKALLWDAAALDALMTKLEADFGLASVNWSRACRIGIVVGYVDEAQVGRLRASRLVETVVVDRECVL